MKKDGTFELASVSEGSYALYVAGLEQGWYVKSARFGQDDILEKGLQLEKENASAKLDIVISSDSAQLEGSVSDGERNLVGARVRVVPDPETVYNRHRLRETRTDQTGHFELTGLPPGKYRVVAIESVTESPRKSSPQMISLSEHEQKSLRLTIPRTDKE